MDQYLKPTDIRLVTLDSLWKKDLEVVQDAELADISLRLRNYHYILNYSNFWSHIVTHSL